MINECNCDDKVFVRGDDYPDFLEVELEGADELDLVKAVILIGDLEPKVFNNPSTTIKIPLWGEESKLLKKNATLYMIVYYNIEYTDPQTGETSTKLIKATCESEGATMIETSKEIYEESVPPNDQV